MALTVGDVWRWGMRDANAHRDMDKAWRQLLRWLVTDVPNRVDLAVERQPEDPNGTVSLRVRVRDPKFQPLDNASVSLEVQPVMVQAAAEPMTNSIRLHAEPSARRTGPLRSRLPPARHRRLQGNRLCDKFGGPRDGPGRGGLEQPTWRLRSFAP